MTATVVFRASDRAEFGPHAHLLAEQQPPQQGATVVRTLCGKVGIGPILDRPDANCPTCWAMSGRHPGGRGKRYLHKQWEAAR